MVRLRQHVGSGNPRRALAAGEYPMSAAARQPHASPALHPPPPRFRPFNSIRRWKVDSISDYLREHL